MRGLVHRQLRFGYNVARGFVTAQEEALGFIDFLVDDGHIAKHITNNCNATKEAVVHELGAGLDGIGKQAAWGH